jgi:hypothetical protein
MVYAPSLVAVEAAPPPAPLSVSTTPRRAPRATAATAAADLSVIVPSQGRSAPSAATTRRARRCNSRTRRARRRSRRRSFHDRRD